MKSVEGVLDASGKTVGIVVSRWNEFITKQLLEGALDTLRKCGDPIVVVVHVPGTWEIPPVAKELTSKVDGVIALGCILQGATPHAGLLAGDVGSALMSIQVETGVPVAWGVLTPETQEQALERTGMKLGHKGREAALAVVEAMSALAAVRSL